MRARIPPVLLTIALAACGGAGGHSPAEASRETAGPLPQGSVAVTVAPAPVARGPEPALAPVGRPIVVVFRASWSSASRDLGERTLADPRVKGLLAGAEVSYVDATDADDPTVAAAIAREQVSVLPCIVVHAARDQTAREYLNGFVTAEVLLAALDRASQ